MTGAISGNSRVAARRLQSLDPGVVAPLATAHDLRAFGRLALALTLGNWRRIPADCDQA
jgi:hypothetical protein